MSNEIPKALYEKAACWMVDNEDSCLLEETQSCGFHQHQYLLEKAFEIMEEIYDIYSKSDGGRKIKTS